MNDQKLQQIPFSKYFSNLSFGNKILLWGGTLSAIFAGIAMPAISLVMGNISAAFSAKVTSNQKEELVQTMAGIGQYVIILAIMIFLFSYIFYSFWQHLAANITHDLKKRYIEALFQQEISYFEQNKIEQIPAQISEVFDNLQNSIGEKISNLIFALSTCIASIGYALCYGWLFALLSVAYLPFLMGVIAFFGRSVQKTTIEKLEGVKQLAGVAEETLMAIKVVASYCQEEREIEKFAKWARKTMQTAKNQQKRFSLTVGATKFSIFFFYSYALFIGSLLIQYKVINSITKRPYDGQTVIQVIIALITGFVGLISALPNIQAIIAAKTLGAIIFEVIERTPLIKNVENPVNKISLTQKITFENVTFRYPTADPEFRPIFDSVNFSIKSGEITAIVGASGSGKSTIVQLLQRFYDPAPGGAIKFDDLNIKEIQLKELKEKIGYVQQEPILIMGSIRDNLLFGNRDASEYDISHALKLANANFVEELENGLDTYVGTASVVNLSGGQKQRIAIARALIKKPVILVLDEATSALDPLSERDVQNAIIQISESEEKITIIMIAHRLTTIECAQNLLYFMSPSNLVSAKKGTDQYIEIIQKLTCIQQEIDNFSSDGEEEKFQAQEISIPNDFGSSVEYEASKNFNQNSNGKIVVFDQQHDNQINNKILQIPQTAGTNIPNPRDYPEEPILLSKYKNFLSRFEDEKSMSQSVEPLQEKDCFYGASELMNSSRPDLLLHSMDQSVLQRQSIQTDDDPETPVVHHQSPIYVQDTEINKKSSPFCIHEIRQSPFKPSEFKLVQSSEYKLVQEQVLTDLVDPITVEPRSHISIISNNKLRENISILSFRSSAEDPDLVLLDSASEKSKEFKLPPINKKTDGGFFIYPPGTTLQNRGQIDFSKLFIAPALKIEEESKVELISMKKPEMMNTIPLIQQSRKNLLIFAPNQNLDFRQNMSPLPNRSISKVLIQTINSNVPYRQSFSIPYVGESQKKFQNPLRDQIRKLLQRNSADQYNMPEQQLSLFIQHSSQKIVETSVLRQHSGVMGKQNSLLKRQESLGNVNQINLMHHSNSIKRQMSLQSQQSYTASDQNQQQQFILDVIPYRDIKVSEIMAFYSPTWLAYIGFGASLAASCQLPLFGYVLSQFIFIIMNSEKKNFIFERNLWTATFVMLCCGIGLSSYIQKLSFALGGENLTYTLRVKLFRALMHKSVGWYDDKTRAPGALTNIITQDISALNGLSTESIAIAVEAALGLFFSCLICFLFTWQVALVVTVTCPFMVLGGLGISRLQFSQTDIEVSSKLANALLNDIIMNYRTVISFGEKNVQFILGRYEALLLSPHQANIKRAHISGLFFGYSTSIRFVYIAFVFYISALLSTKYGLNKQSVFTACYVVFVGAIGSGVSMSQMPSISKAKQSAQTVFQIIEEDSEISPSQKGVTAEPSGTIEFKNCYFNYPSRKQSILRNLSLKILPNQSVAIVGHSGTGKSTIASLLLRFYDVAKGQILIDGVNIKDYDLKSLRSKISIVQQEPMLWNESIKENILYGIDDASNEEIVQAATQANAMTFITEEDPNKILEEFNKLNKLQKCVDVLESKKLKIVTQLVKRLTDKGLDELEVNIDDFISAVNLSSSWSQALKLFMFQEEANNIREFVLNNEFMQQIDQCIIDFPCCFDLETIYNYLKDSPKKNKSTFIQFIEVEQKRVQQFYEKEYNQMIDQEKCQVLDAELDPGFQRLCGIKGGKLSGGQKQRIAIARALIKSPKILILDEATSALDEHSQNIVQEALEKAMQGRTSIVIAHRLSTIKCCNRIIVLYKGKVVEDGTYEELSRIPNGHFARLEAGIL